MNRRDQEVLTEEKRYQRASFVQRVRVPLGFIFAVVFALYSQPTAAWLRYGIIIAAMGLILRLWSSAYLKKHQALCLAGPYRWTRNPLYLGSFLLGTGFSVAAANLWLLLLFGILFPAIYIPVMRKEETELTKVYGSEYQEYRKRVPAFFPSLRPLAVSEKSNFSLHQIVLNREYKAVLGFLTIAVFLLVKLKWL